MSVIKKSVLLVFIFAILISCTKKTVVDGDTLTIGGMVSMDYLPLAIAINEGYTRQEGVSVEIKRFYSAVERDSALQSGALDGTVTDFTGAVLQKAGGMDLKLVSRCEAPFYIIAGKGTGIETIKDLKGKSVAVSQNTVIDYLIDTALNQAGLEPKDITKVEINRIPLRFEMLDNAKIDATGLPDPIALVARFSGHKVVATNHDLGVAVTGIVFTDKALEKKGGLIKKMYKAYDRGVDYLHSHSVEDIKGILIKDFGFAESMVDNVTLPNYAYAASPTEEEMESVISWLKARGLIEGSFEAERILYNQVLQ